METSPTDQQNVPSNKQRLLSELVEVKHTHSSWRRAALASAVILVALVLVALVPWLFLQSNTL